jgi:hypothetical protein
MGAWAAFAGGRFFPLSERRFNLESLDRTHAVANLEKARSHRMSARFRRRVSRILFGRKTEYAVPLAFPFHFLPGLFCNHCLAGN